jgi:membrane-associated phospholipid phosphatase
VKAALRRVAPLQLVDRYGLRMLLRTRSTPVDRVALALSHLGRGGLAWFALAAAIGSGRRELRRRDGTIASASAIAAALTASALLARVTQRPRPCQRGVRPLIPCPEGGSLPSDQAAAAFAAAELLGWLEPQARPFLRASAALLALSRVAVGVHYPTDTLAGAALGAGLGHGAKRLAIHFSGRPE